MMPLVERRPANHHCAGLLVLSLSSVLRENPCKATTYNIKVTAGFSVKKSTSEKRQYYHIQDPVNHFLLLKKTMKISLNKVGCNATRYGSFVSAHTF